jgi:hypothetical protein
MLDTIHQALLHLEAEAARALDAGSARPIQLSPGTDDSGTPEGSSVTSRRQEAISVSLARADLMAADVERVLQDGETALRRWLTQVAEVRQRVAKQASFPVS